MKYRGIVGLVVVLSAASPGIATAQPVQMNPPAVTAQAMPGAGPKMDKMGPGMMQGEMPCMQGMQEMQEMQREMPCMQMMQKMGPKMMAKRDHGRMRMGAGAETGLSFFMAPFHRWMNLLMAHREVLGLSPEQVDQVDAAVTEHLKVAVRGQAEIQAQLIELKHSLRGPAMNLQAIESLLKNVSDRQLQLQSEGVRLYDKILNTILTEEQKKKTRELIGGPFPTPWQQMTDMPSPHSKDDAGSSSKESKSGGKAQGAQN
jgi:hypothetical protein